MALHGGQAIATVWRTAGKAMAGKFPIFIPDPRLDTVLAALQETALTYLDKRAATDVPFWAMVAAPVSGLRERAEAIAAAVSGAHPSAVAAPMESLPGAGSAPGITMPSHGVTIDRDLLEARAVMPGRRPVRTLYRSYNSSRSTRSRRGLAGVSANTTIVFPGITASANAFGSVASTKVTSMPASLTSQRWKP